MERLIIYSFKDLEKTFGGNMESHGKLFIERNDGDGFDSFYLFFSSGSWTGDDEYYILLIENAYWVGAKSLVIHEQQFLIFLRENNNETFDNLYVIDGYLFDELYYEGGDDAIIAYLELLKLS